MKAKTLKISVVMGLLCLAEGCNTSRVMAWNNSGIPLRVTIDAKSTRLWEGVIAPGSTVCFKFQPGEDGAFRLYAGRPDGTKVGPVDVDYYTPDERATHLIEIGPQGDVLPRVYEDYHSRLTCAP